MHTLSYTHKRSYARKWNHFYFELKKKKKQQKLSKPFKIYLLYSLQIAGSLWLELFLLLSAFLCKFFFFSALCHFPSRRCSVTRCLVCVCVCLCLRHRIWQQIFAWLPFQTKIHLWIFTKVYTYIVWVSVYKSVVYKKNFSICNPWLFFMNRMYVIEMWPRRPRICRSYGVASSELSSRFRLSFILLSSVCVRH